MCDDVVKLDWQVPRVYAQNKKLLIILTMGRSYVQNFTKLQMKIKTIIMNHPTIGIMGGAIISMSHPNVIVSASSSIIAVTKSLEHHPSLDFLPLMKI